VTVESETVVGLTVFSENLMLSRVRHILRRLEELRAQIELACVRNVRFRATCEDYGEAVEALEHWKGSSAIEATERISEYSDLIAGLEDEILDEIRNRRKSA
jgi:hypothetical protein